MLTPNHKSFEDTIAAIATPVGIGGIGVVKISGRFALRTAESIFRKKNQALIEKLTTQVNMLIARLCKVMSSYELRRLLASAGLIMAMNAAPIEAAAQSFGPPVNDPFV